MARVFVAEEVALGRRVVVKVLAPELAEGLSADRFAREAKLAAGLQDPRIVPVLSAGGVGDLPFYTMPFVEGESLRARMTRGAVPVPEAVDMLRDIALALEYAHARDVADFGIAKALAAANTTGAAPGAALTQAGVSLGTPAYMAPEQAAGDDVDHRADLYAWGVIAYELLAGRHPFADKTSAQQLIAAHIAEQPASLGVRRPTVPAKLAALVMQSLEKDPSRRPASAHDLVATIDSIATTPNAGAGVTPAGRGWGMALAGVILLGAAIGWWMLTHQPAAKTDVSLIAVVPFRVTSGDASLAYLREGMVDLIAAKLVGSPRTVDQRTVLAAWRRAGGGQDIDRATAARMAASLGAGGLIEGDIVGSSSDMTVTASLVDSVIAKLLVINAGENSQRVASLASTPIAALEAYLAGQADYRAGRYAQAADQFTDALATDSTFALAAFGLSVASDWMIDPRGNRGRTLAARYAAKLGVRDRLLLGPTNPDSVPTTYAGSLAERDSALVLVKDSPDLWYRLGDYQFHYGPAVTNTPDAWRSSIAALERGLTLDSSYAPLLEHLPHEYLFEGDTARARLAIARLMRDTAAYYYAANRVFYAPDSVARALALRELAQKPPVLAGYTVFVAMLRDNDFSFAETLLRDARSHSATAADRRFIDEVRFNVAIDGGKPGLAARIAADLPARQADRMFVATFWDGDSTAGAAQYKEATALVSQTAPADANARTSWAQAIFDVAQYELARNDTTRASRVMTQLRALPRVPGDPVASARPSRLALIIDAQLAARAGRADAPQRLATLDSLLRLGPKGGRIRLAGNLVASRLWERAGDLRRAYEAAQRWAITNNAMDGSLYATYLREQGRLAEAANDHEAAIDAYRRYLHLRANPEPVLARDVAAVRSELKKLERQSAGR